MIFLFVIVIKALSRMMSATMDRGILSDLLVGLRSNEEIVVLHLLFTGDTLIFCEADCEHLCNRCCVFYVYKWFWG